MRPLVLCALLAACDARLGANTSGENNGTGNVDAPSGTSSTDAGGSTSNNDGGGMSMTTDAGMPATGCTNGRVVFLNFAGDTLTQATTSDATQDEAVWVGMNGGGQTTATMPEWRPTAADRTTQISDVVTTLQGIFGTIAPTITFVTTRPAAGPYVMIGFGGTKGEAGVPYTGAVNHLDCGDTNKNDLGWVFESEPSVIAAANAAAGAIGFGMGATGTTDPNDCMCAWLTQCTQSEAAACSFSATADAALSCPNETDPQDDVTILNAFCN